MNKRGMAPNIHIIGRFILFIFVLVILFMFVSPIFDVSSVVRSEMGCSETFTFMCFVAMAALPLLFIIVLSLILKYLLGGEE